MRAPRPCTRSGAGFRTRRHSFLGRKRESRVAWARLVRIRSNTGRAGTLHVHDGEVADLLRLGCAPVGALVPLVLLDDLLQPRTALANDVLVSVERSPVCVVCVSCVCVWLRW